MLQSVVKIRLAPRPRCARLARRDDREYREHLSEDNPAMRDAAQAERAPQRGSRAGEPECSRTFNTDCQARTLQPIERAANAKCAAVQHMGVHHRRRHVRVTEKFLDGPNVVTIGEQVRRK